MSQGISESFDLIIERIESLVPKRNLSQPFTCLRNSLGNSYGRETMTLTQRLFWLTPESLPEDDGELGISGRKRVRVNLSVWYALPHEQALAERMLLEDTAYIIDTLKSPNYNQSTTGIISLVLQPSTLEPMLDDTGEPTGTLLNITFDLLYLEA